MVLTTRIIDNEKAISDVLVVNYQNQTIRHDPD